MFMWNDGEEILSPHWGGKEKAEYVVGYHGDVLRILSTKLNNTEGLIEQWVLRRKNGYAAQIKDAIRYTKGGLKLDSEACVALDFG